MDYVALEGSLPCLLDRSGLTDIPFRLSFNLAAHRLCQNLLVVPNFVGSSLLCLLEQESLRRLAPDTGCSSHLRSHPAAASRRNLRRCTVACLDLDCNRLQLSRPSWVCPSSCQISIFPWRNRHHNFPGFFLDSRVIYRKLLIITASWTLHLDLKLYSLPSPPPFLVASASLASKQPTEF